MAAGRRCGEAKRRAATGDVSGGGAGRQSDVRRRATCRAAVRGGKATCGDGRRVGRRCGEAEGRHQRWEAGRSDAGILSSGRCDAVPLSSILSAGEPSTASSGGGCERATTLLLPYGSGRHERREKGRGGDRRRDLGSSPPSTAARALSPSATIIRYRRRHSGSSPPSGLIAATRACPRHPLSLGLRPHSSQPLPAVAAAGSSRAERPSARAWHVGTLFVVREV
uniref:Uncharacterized protein n=1 Tax=Oryza glumipatula TaxID=40148 RepID=A0A0E0A8H5_9ORYZ